MNFLEILKAIFLGVVQGITEWLPVSSTGHMILVNQFIKMDVSPEFWEMLLAVIQLGSIMAVVVLYWNNLFPFSFKNGFGIDKDKFVMWFKILVASVPAAIVGLLWDDEIDALFYNYTSVAVALIVFGVLFLVIETYNKGKRPRVKSIGGITYRAAIVIGLFQMIAAVFPGTSRSGATIIGALLIGIARTTAAEFTFFLAIPAMLGASVLKVAKFASHTAAGGVPMTGSELIILVVATGVAFVVSIAAIKFLMGYIKKHDFKAFGWYRIVLGVLVLAYFAISGAQLIA